MLRRHSYSVLALIACLGIHPAASAQITFNYNFASGSGFPGSTANPGYYTADRQAAIIRAGDYLRTQFDARGTVNVAFGTQSLGGSTLAVGGTSYFTAPAATYHGFRRNGVAFQQATSGNTGLPQHLLVDFNVNQTAWHTATAPSSTTGLSDMQSTALHEFTHGLGFSSLIRANGAGFANQSPGAKDVYTQLDGNLRVGGAANATPLLTQTQGDVRFNTPAATAADLTGSNIFFHGEFAKAANGGNAVQMAGGGDVSHLGAGVPANAVMLPSSLIGTDQRAYTAIDLAILIDNGWNQFAWKNATGNFADNVASTANAKWQNLDVYDTLSPVGTITTNMVLRFGGSGGYTATNNLTLAATAATNNDTNRFLLTRLILTGTAGSSTIAATNGNVLRFDSTIGVAPQIRQDGAGAFVISHPVELTGRNLQLTGDGAGVVTLSGTIGQQTGQVGSVTKLGSSTFVLSGNNSYSGGTAVNAGTLLVTNTSGSGTGTGAVTVNAGGTLGGTGIIGGATTVKSGGTIRGDSGTGTGTLSLASTTLESGGFLAVNIAATGTNSKLNLGSNVLDLNAGARLRLTAITGFGTAADSSYTIATLTDGANLKRNGTTVADGFVFGTFVQGVGNGGSDSVLLDVSALNFTLGNGHTFTLARVGNNLVLTFSPVPEPATVLAVGVAGLAASSWLRRRYNSRRDAALAA